MHSARSWSVFLCVLFCIAAGRVRAVEFETLLDVRVDAHTPSSPDAPMVAFAAEPVVATVKIGFFRHPETPRTVSSKLPLPSRWWDQIAWSVRNEAGDTVPVVATLLHADESTTHLAPDQAVEAVYDLGRLGIGVYDVRVSLPGLSATAGRQVTRVAVRTGTEDPLTRRAYLTSEFRRTTSYREQKRLLLELAELEPRNPDHYETLAELSIREASTAEVQQYFDRALAIIRSNASRAQRRNEHGKPDIFDRDIRRLTLARNLVPELKKNDSIELGVTWVDGEKRYDIRNRATGAVRRVLE